MEADVDATTTVYRVKRSRNAFKKLKVVSRGVRPSRDILSSKYVFVVDCVAEVFVWVGSAVQVPERRLALRVARHLQQVCRVC